MTSPDSREQLSLVEAQLFASTQLAVISAIDKSADSKQAVINLRELGMSQVEAETVLEMPLRTRTQLERERLLIEAERLRALFD